jgi:hypothetical protein
MGFVTGFKGLPGSGSINIPTRRNLSRSSELSHPPLASWEYFVLFPKMGREKGYNLKNAILLTETDQWRFALRCDQCPYQVAVSFDHQW